MKVIAVLLSITFLALNLVPCSDAGDIDNDSRAVLAIDHGGHHGHDSPGDLCSPFCQCHCCHVHTLEFGVTAFQPLQPSISRENFAHFDSPGKDIPRSLLQPPRV